MRSRRSALLFALFALLALLASTPACSAQLGPGIVTGGKDAVPRALTGEVRWFAPRRSGPLLGAAGTLASTGDRARPLQVRSATVNAGWHWRTPRAFPTGLGAEVALELGLGQPALRDFQGVGAYVGGSGSVLYRLWGPGDDTPRFDVLTPLVDLVLTARSGLWSAPEGQNAKTGLEGGGHIAVRLTLSSDLSAPRQPERQDVAPAAPTESPGEYR